MGFLRLLLFVYTDTLPDGSDGALLEDLMAADRYGLVDMKLLCENMLVPSQSNWLDLLRAADLLGSQRIQLLVTAFLRDNFSLLEPQKSEQLRSGESAKLSEKNEEVITENSSLIELKEEFPGLLEQLFERRKEISPLPPSQVLIAQINAQQASRYGDASKPPLFPVWSLVVAAVCLLAYQYTSKYVSMGWLIPAVNVGGLVVLVAVLFKVMNK